MGDEAKFPFDVKGFQKAVDQMSNSISSMETKLNKFGGTMQKSVSKGIMSATAKIGLLVKGFKSVMKNMPEIGQAFKIAGDIMSKEFFFPIRQQIMPYLQKMLDWTRDHRALFAKWGQAVADVLKTVIDVGKTLYNTLKDVVGVLTNSLQKGLETSFKSLDEFISVLQVKIAFVTLLIGDVISAMFEKIAPTFEYVVGKGAEVLRFFGDLVSSWLTLNNEGASLQTVCDKLFDIFDKIVHIIGDSLGAFFEGLVKPLKNIMTPLDDIMSSFQRLLSIFGDDNSGIKGVFSWLGNFVGNILLIAFEELAWAIGTVVDGIMTLVRAGSMIGDIFSGDWDALSKHASEVGDIWSAWLDRNNETGERQLNALVSGVTGGNKEPLKLKFADEWGTYNYAGKMGGWDSWTNETGTVLPTKDKKSYYRYRSGNKEEQAILNEIKNGNYTRMHDGFISKDGHIVQLDPDDNIYAFKRRPMGGITAPMNMVFNVTVTEGNAQSVGQQLGYSIHKSFVDRLKEQQMAGGW
jgi:hypothetical protein